MSLRPLHLMPEHVVNDPNHLLHVDFFLPAKIDHNIRSGRNQPVWVIYAAWRGRCLDGRTKEALMNSRICLIVNTT